MKKVIIFLLVLSVFGFSNTFQLSTTVVDQQLIPVIKINGKSVIQIQDVGTKQSYASTFERSEKIFNSLQEVQNNKVNLNRIRIRRNKSDYVAYIDNIEIYRVTPSDIIGSDLTVYQMAAQWRKNITEALNLASNTNLPLNSVNDDVLEDSTVPLIGMLSIFSKSSVFVMALQVIVFVIIQIIAIWLTFNYLNNRYRSVLDEFQKRLKKFHVLQIKNNHVISKLENQVVDLDSKLKSQRSSSKKVSNIGSVSSTDG